MCVACVYECVCVCVCNPEDPNAADSPCQASAFSSSPAHLHLISLDMQVYGGHVQLDLHNTWVPVTRALEV